MKNILLPLLILLLWALPLPAGAQARDSLVYTVVDQMPEFIGSMNAYFARNIRVSKEDVESGFSGRLQATFVVTKSGEIRDVVLIKGKNTQTGEHFVTALKSMPAWRPALHKGVPVNFKYVLPLQLCFQE